MALVRVVSLLGVGTALFGLILLSFSNGMYYGRTLDRNYLRLWLPKTILTKREYIANRLGFCLIVLGLTLLIVFALARRSSGV